jgi:hypothetical protein
MYRAAMSNYYTMGQSNTYLFNFFTNDRYPYQIEHYGLLRDLASCSTLRGRDKHFMVTFESELPGEKLPAVISEADTPCTISIFVGDDLEQAKRGNILKRVLLGIRIGALEPDDQLEFALNGELLPIANAVVERPDFQEFLKMPAWIWDREKNKEPFAWVNFNLENQLPKVGANQIRITLKNARDSRHDSLLKVTAVDIQVSYNIMGVVK